MGMDTDEEELTTDDEFDVIATGHHRRPYQPHRVVSPLGDDTEEEEEDDDDDGVYKPSRPGSGGSTITSVSLQQQQSSARGFRESYRPASGNTLDLRLWSRPRKPVRGSPYPGPRCRAASRLPTLFQGAAAADLYPAF